MELKSMSIRNHKGKVICIILATVLIVGYFILFEPLTYHQYHRDIVRMIDNDFDCHMES
jgi:hypothetical protein